MLLWVQSDQLWHRWVANSEYEHDIATESVFTTKDKRERDRNIPRTFYDQENLPVCDGCSFVEVVPGAI